MYNKNPYQIHPYCLTCKYTGCPSMKKTVDYFGKITLTQCPYKLYHTPTTTGYKYYTTTCVPTTSYSWTPTTNYFWSYTFNSIQVHPK